MKSNTWHNINTQFASGSALLGRLVEALEHREDVFIVSPFTDTGIITHLSRVAASRPLQSRVQILVRDPLCGRFPSVDTDKALRALAANPAKGLDVRVLGRMEYFGTEPSGRGGTFHAKFWYLESGGVGELFLGSANLNYPSWNSVAEVGAWLTAPKDEFGSFLQPWRAAWACATPFRDYLSNHLVPLATAFPEYSEEGGERDWSRDLHDRFNGTRRGPTGADEPGRHFSVRLSENSGGSSGREGAGAPSRTSPAEGAGRPTPTRGDRMPPAVTAVAPLTHELRPYQRTLVDQLHELHKKKGNDFSGVVVLPTGGGKTTVAATWCTEAFLLQGKRVLWLAHRDELLQGARDAFERIGFPREAITEARDSSDMRRGSVVLAMTPTICVNVEALGLLVAARFDCVVFDEAHHALADMTLEALKELRGSARGPRPLLGLTATPFRTDRTELEFLQDFFSAEAVRGPEFAELVRQGHVARPRWFDLESAGPPRHVEPEMLRGGPSGFVDFNSDFLEKFGATDAANERAVRHWVKHRTDFGPTLVFAVNIDHGYRLTQLFRKAGVGAVFVSGKTRRDERRESIDRFRRGDLPIIVNCGVFTEGTDVPAIRTILLARPTMSEVLYLQMIGRGARIAPGKDTFCVMDVTDNIQMFGAGAWASTRTRIERNIG